MTDQPDFRALCADLITALDHDGLNAFEKAIASIRAAINTPPLAQIPTDLLAMADELEEQP